MNFKAFNHFNNSFQIKLIYLSLIFIFSRFFYYEFFDIKFDTWTVDVYWQFIPKEFLEKEFLNSIIFNHWQAPLLNILLGISMKITDNYFLIIQIIYLFFGFCSFVLIYLISKNFNFSEKNSFIISVILMIFPTTILYENHFYKEYLTFFFLLWTFYSSTAIYKYPYSAKYILYLSFSLSFLCLTRETFHIFWAFILIFIIQRNLVLKNKILLILIFTSLTLPFYLKNLIIFNKFALNTTYVYEHLNQKIDYVKEMDDPNRHVKIRNFTFGSYENYQKFKKKTSQLYDVPIFTDPFTYANILDYKYKRNIKLLNSNTLFNEVFFDVEKYRKKDFFLIIKEEPLLILINILNSVTRHLFTSSDYFNFTKHNADKMKFMIKISDCIKFTPICVYDYKFNWKINYTIDNQPFLSMDTGPLSYHEKIIYSLQYTNFFLVFLYLSIFVYLIKLLFFNKNRGNEGILIFWLLTFVLIFTSLVVFEDGEIARHRFPFDYLCFLIFLKQVKEYFLKKREF